MDGSERIVSRGKLNIIRVNINIFDLIGVGELWDAPLGQWLGSRGTLNVGTNCLSYAWAKDKVLDYLCLDLNSVLGGEICEIVLDTYTYSRQNIPSAVPHFGPDFSRISPSNVLYG